jgi:O-antigen ligase
LLLTLAGTVLAKGGTPALAWSVAEAVLCGLAIAASFLRRDSRAAWFLRWPAVFLTWCLVSLAFSTVPARSWFFLAQWTAYVAGSLAAFLAARSGGGRILANGLIVLAAGEGVYGLVQYLQGVSNATGSYRNHNHLAGLLTLALAPALALGVPRLLAGSGRGALYFAGSGVAMLGLLFTRSRMGISSALVTVALFIAYVAVKSRRRAAAIWMSLIPALVLGYGLWIGIGPVGQRFAETHSGRFLQNEARFTIWRDTLTLIAARPWTGWGPGTFPAVYPTVRTEPGELRWMEAHCDYLQILCELGAPGFLLLFGPLAALVAGLILRAWRMPLLVGIWPAALAASLSGILLHSATDFHLYVPANAMWIAVLAGLGAGELAENGSPPGPQRSDRLE